MTNQENEWGYLYASLAAVVLLAFPYYLLVQALEVPQIVAVPLFLVVAFAFAAIGYDEATGMTAEDDIVDKGTERNPWSPEDIDRFMESHDEDDFAADNEIEAGAWSPEGIDQLKEYGYLKTPEDDDREEHNNDNTK